RGRSYKTVKASAFLFETPEQRATVLKQLQKFEAETGAGLEVHALRRTYRERRQGSLADLAEVLYRLIRAGKSNLLKELNAYKRRSSLDVPASDLRDCIKDLRAQAQADLRQRIDTRNLPPSTLTTAILLTEQDDVDRLVRRGE